MDDITKEQVRSPERIEKQPWQMTKAEYETVYGVPRGNSTVTGNFSKHKSAVEIALNRGLQVPPEVLKDYPDLVNLQ
ncbi:MAG: hypothetical protein EA369_04045 [Bradymonadales bacterium]|nr:MAG: hypothetical protein EA369_04045 [Bradymonadales bacterium]